MQSYFKKDGDDDQNPPIVNQDPDTPGPEAGEYVHPVEIPGDEYVDNSQLG